jgi:hypothetical protein
MSSKFILINNNHKGNKKALLVLPTILICCTNAYENEPQPQAEEQENRSPIIRLLEEFKESHSIPLTKTSSFLEFNIVNIETETYTCDVADQLEDSPVLDALESDETPDLFEVEIHTVEFENGGNKGFAIVSDDERINRVYAYTESGETVCEQDLLHFYNNEKASTKGGFASRLLVQPITGLLWNKCAPYNQLVPACSGVGAIYAGHAPAGCTPVAIAQAVAYLCPPSLSSSNINSLRNVGSYTDGTTEEAWVNNMASWVRYIGTCVGVNYGCSGSGAWISNITDEFNTWGINYSIGIDVNVNIQSMAYNLYKGYPHITTGFTKNPREGHTWLWEGIDCYQTEISSSTKKVTIVPNTMVTVYCNWGWGRNSSSGWYAQANMEHPSDKPLSFLDDNEQLYITGTTFTVPAKGQIVNYY